MGKCKDLERNTFRVTIDKNVTSNNSKGEFDQSWLINENIYRAMADMIFTMKNKELKE